MRTALSDNFVLTLSRVRRATRHGVPLCWHQCWHDWNRPTPLFCAARPSPPAWIVYGPITPKQIASLALRELVALGFYHQGGQRRNLGVQ